MLWVFRQSTFFGLLYSRSLHCGGPGSWGKQNGLEASGRNVCRMWMIPRQPETNWRKQSRSYLRSNPYCQSSSSWKENNTSVALLVLTTLILYVTEYSASSHFWNQPSLKEAFVIVQGLAWSGHDTSGGIGGSKSSTHFVFEYTFFWLRVRNPAHFWLSLQTSVEPQKKRFTLQNRGNAFIKGSNVNGRSKMLWSCLTSG